MSDDRKGDGCQRPVTKQVARRVCGEGLTLGLCSDPVLVGLDLAGELRVHLCRCSCGCLCLVLAEVARAEQELSVQVGLLDRVHVGHVDLAVRSGSESHHRPVLEHLAPDRTRPDEELSVVGDLGVERKTENGDLAVVPRSLRLAVLLGRERRRQRLERVKVEVLDHRVELGRARLEHLLGDEPSEHSVHRRERTRRLVRELGEDLLVQLVVRRVGLEERVGNLDDLGSVLGVSGAGQARVLRLEQREGLVTVVERLRSVPLCVVGDEELWARERLGEGLERDDLWHLDLGEHTPASVLGQAGRVPDRERVGT